MLKPKYNHKDIEANKYDHWIKAGYFESGDLSKEPFCIVIPPPNVTGKLHFGHALDNTLEDSLARYKRLRGYDVLWLPGMDHAGIATQAKIEEHLRKQNISKYDLGREKFLEEAWAWKEEYATHIHRQWASLGNSFDYRKQRFTLDEGLSQAVKKVFVDLYKDGLIYQGLRIINWDPKFKTALSNIEVIYKETKGKMYYFNYPFADEEGAITIATTRPETMFADVCVVVNPSDERYQKHIGKKVINPANGALIPIIADSYIDVSFGTGAMKCTPAHDPNDYQIGLRYHLEMPVCMNDDATMNELALEFKGLDRFEARQKLVEKIKSEGHFVKEEEIIHNVGYSERSDVMVEPYLSKQWFVKMEPLAQEVLKAQQNPETKINFYPKRFEKTFTNWLSDIEDWCISRQLWWGHRIPIYYHKQTGEIYCEMNEPSDIENYVQDEDVLDTWFSSALWPFSTLGWPNDTFDLNRYFPNSCMITGYDIIFFWVTRMAICARYFMHDVAFKDCLLHGLIRDSQGRKMSKSLGNGLDPLEIIDQYGTDALRYYLASSATPGLDTNYHQEKIEAAWNFINKLYNASRFVLINIREDDQLAVPSKPSKVDLWILDKLNKAIKQATLNMDRYEFALVCSELTDFVWNDFCSNYIEFAKSGLNSLDASYRSETLNTLVCVLDRILRLLSPFIPFITEEIYLNLYPNKKSINLESWPQILDLDNKDCASIDFLIEIIRVTREFKLENNLKPSSVVYGKLDSSLKLDQEMLDILSKMAKLELISDTQSETVVRVLPQGSISFILDGLIDKEAEKAKLEAELKRLEQEILRSNNILNNDNFIKKAPITKVEEEKNKLEKYLNQKAVCLEKLKQL